MASAELWISLEEDLEKLKRNETQMTEEQKKQYAIPLESLRSKIKAEAKEVEANFFYPNLVIKKEDKGKIKKYLKKIKVILDDSEQTYVKAFKKMFETYKLDDFLDVVIPIHEDIKYKVYGEYWLENVTLENGKYTNPILELRFGTKFLWDEELKTWLSGNSFVKALPPTKKELDEEYARLLLERKATA